MQAVSKNEIDSRFLDLYDKYSPALFGLLLKLMETKAQAESVLIEVFEKIYREKLYNNHTACVPAALLRLAFITACKRQFNSEVFFEKVNALPWMHRLLLGNINLQTFSVEPVPYPADYGREISGELRSIQIALNSAHNNYGTENAARLL